jgi:hypothetical protein
VLITSIAVVLFSTASIARIMGWSPNWNKYSGDILALDQMTAVPGTSESRAKPRCAECGVFVSMREIEGHEPSGAEAAAGVTAGNGDELLAQSTKSFEIIVRMADGSYRVIDDPKPATWRPGEGVIIIGGVDSSNR